MAPIIQKDRQQASHYPFPLTHLIGLSWFISAGITAGILCYFTYYLRQDNMSVPLQLIFPLVVSLLSLVGILYVFSIHTFSVSSARANLVVSLSLFALSTASLGLVTWKLSHMVLSHACTTQLWQTDMGVMVCRIYKALYAFTVIGWLCSGASAALDFKVSASQSSRGVYQAMGSGKDGMGVSRQRGNYVEMKDESERLTPQMGSETTPKL